MLISLLNLNDGTAGSSCLDGALPIPSLAEQCLPWLWTAQPLNLELGCPRLLSVDPAYSQSSVAQTTTTEHRLCMLFHSRPQRREEAETAAQKEVLNWGL